MALPSSVTGGVFDIEFAAWRWSRVVDVAGHSFADFTGQRDTTRLGRVSATHADDSGRYRQRHFFRHTLPPRKRATGQFDRMKIDAEAGTAGATTLADIHGKVTRQRQR